MASLALLHFLLLSLLLVFSDAAGIDCSIASIQSLVPSNATVELVVPITKLGTFKQDDVKINIPTTNIDKSMLPLCVISINIQSSSNTSFNMGLLLPSNWNGRMMATGNPGFGGGTRWDFMGRSLQYGPAATLSTDTGHVGKPNNISFAINDPNAVIDWSWRSLHDSTVLGKQIAKAFYGNEIKHSYYTACSNGGRQGMKEVQDFPDDYDGVLIGAPPWQITHLHPWALQLGIWNLPNNSAAHIPSWKFPMIAKAMLEQCDPQDGVTDQIVMEPYSCNFSAEALLCNKTSNHSTCLTGPQIDTLSLMYNDWQASNGSLVFPRFPLSATASRYGAVTTAPNHFGLEYFYGFIENSTDWDWTTFGGEKTLEYVDALNTGDAAALSFDLSAFRANGGKMLMYHGLADGTIPTGSSIDYYEGVNRTMVPASADGSIDDFYKLYLVPGMGHCGSSDKAPYYIAAAGQVVKQGSDFGFSVPGYSDPQHDVVLAMFQWVENSTEPSSIIATKWLNDTVDDGLVMQRPLCPYPRRAVYVGSGDVNAASSWKCEVGEVLQFPTPNGSVGTVKAIDKLGSNGMYNYSCGTNCTPDTSQPDGATGTATSNSAGGATSSSSAAAASMRALGAEGLQFLGWCTIMVGLGIGLLI